MFMPCPSPRSPIVVETVSVVTPEAPMQSARPCVYASPPVAEPSCPPMIRCYCVITLLWVGFVAAGSIWGAS
jgi:hypothetical protein